MSSPRAPMQAPVLPGFDFIRLIGSGGYSDVFLYEQHMPRRRVAIKVLLVEGLGESGRQQFHAEANAMAAVSTHPYIVTVLHADISAAGQPFLVMEYYSGANFSVRSRSEQISVADALRTGIQVASAIETAHRSGILHRDIKPANILTSEYNRPGLTDFGIATSEHDQEAEGLSIPWSPPEVINGTAAGDVRADVYSLAATVYSLLAGRSPFEVTSGSNRGLDLIRRIESADPAPTGRPDVPISLERALRHGLSKSPSDRPESAAQFARMLQGVEVEQGWSATQLEIRQEQVDVRHRGLEPDEDGTRLKSPVVIRSQPGTSPRGTEPAARSEYVDSNETTRSASPLGPDTGAAHDGTVHRTSQPEGRTVHRGSIGSQPGGPGGLISSVGSVPVGLSRQGAPRPVQPMPSDEFRSTGTDSVSGGWSVGVEPDVEAPTVSAKSGSSLPVRIAAMVVLGVALVAVLAAVLNGRDPDRGTTQTTTPVKNTLPVVGGVDVPAPADVRAVVVPAEGQTKITWTQPGVDAQEQASYTYQVKDATGSKVLAEVKGEWSASVDAEVACVRVIAVAPGGRVSDEAAESSFAATC